MGSVGRMVVSLCLLSGAWVGVPSGATGQQEAPAPRPVPSAAPAPVHLSLPTPAASDQPLPINLPTALQLAGVRPLDVALAAERIQVAAAQLDRAQVLWLPTLFVGPDYFRHDGQIQDIRGEVFGTSKQSML